ncbi:spermatogenesis associated 6-like protein isoform X1 [Astyanax mexicanus]|uniref:spermatogenesis associated 6-like protein isoform X1 n=1 Tax=Astyanax mexicanus TaxID=7994 RepID=UPI0020CB60D6|nr:spermatogenesis associated 6-like protein isoform X1 [Astyanax mexicanus]
MSQTSLKVFVELHIRAITCPGVHLTAKDDIYLSACLLNQYRKSDCLPAVFPLLFRTKMRFEKIFKYAIDPAAIAEILQCETVKIELIQLIRPAGEILATYEENARSFLFPEPKLVPSFSGGDREVLMTRDPNFPGISPRLEFSTRTTIFEGLERDTVQSVPVRVMTRKRARKSRQRGRSTTARRDTQTQRHRSLSPFKRSESSRTSSSSDIGHRYRKSSWSGGVHSSGWSPESYSRLRNSSPHHSKSPGQLGTIRRRSHSNHLLPNDGSSSDTDDLLDDTEELGQRPPLAGYEGSPSPAALTHSSMASPRQSSSLLCSPNAWEEVQERVRSLLTSPRAVHRLTYGATESEVDKVLTRKSISPHW